MEMSFYENLRDERDMRQTLLKRKMESPLTHDNSMNGERDAVDKLKKAMKLDFNSSGNKQSKLSLLQSPDLNMLKLASPELEKMIIQANGLVTTTPTPTQFIFPKYVTDEQEAYARGFVDALAELHSTPSEPATKVPKIPSSISLSAANMTKCAAPTSNSSVNLTYTTVPSSLSTTTSLPGGLLNVVVPRTVESIHNFALSKVHIKEEPQTVPCLDSSPPLSPIDMDTQEVFKLERKRARNRVAARKCRTRKLERISKLEDKVSDLKGQNTDLSTTANNLRDQVCKLKKQIIDHVSSGCQIMMAPNF